MKDELIKTVPQAIEGAGNVQSGTKNVLIQNEPGANININVQPSPSLTINNDAEKLAALMSFSHDYYQLLVSADDSIFDEKIITFSPNRSLTKSTVPPEIFERCSSLTKEGINELKTIPALICKENRDPNGVTHPDEIGYLGYIKKVQNTGRLIKVVFETISPVPHSALCDKRNAIYFDLNMDCAYTSLNWTEWTVHKTDIFEALDEAGIPYPKF